MRSALLLAAILALSLARGAVCEESQEQAVGRREVSGISQMIDTFSSKIPVSVDVVLETLGKIKKASKKWSIFQKRDMHDFFVGLMGKKNIRPEFHSPVSQEKIPLHGKLKILRKAE